MPGPAPSEFFRLFFAVQIPEEVKTEFEHTQTALRRRLLSTALRWTPREQFHLTLKFLGNVPGSKVEALGASLRQACAAFAPVRLRAERTGFFPNPRAPRVLWAGVAGERDHLSRLQTAVETAALPFSGEKPAERFTAHVTLARIKEIRRAEIETLRPLVEGLSEKAFGEWTADGVDLIRSELLSTGAKYTLLVTAPLAASS